MNTLPLIPARLCYRLAYRAMRVSGGRFSLAFDLSMRDVNVVAFLPAAELAYRGRTA